MSDQLISPDSHSNDPPEGSDSHATAERPGRYIVVARRYRPKSFEELVGQQHVGRALSGAIHSNRVGHAYLFTGARGVGKTSTARILAKALNCVQGPTSTPCNECDICRSISSGDDVDVLEIDGASNRGIEEMRELRQNVSVRPSRARYKIYIIDEVHMLTREAFNALLKTLEEPPEHVKFIFCTTEPEKIPITILSRCQRFDFAGIEPDNIVKRLRQICIAEEVEADDDALALLSRRAAGSMRDSQSLLEQLLSVGEGRITVAAVHQLLGTAGGQRLANLVSALASRRADVALQELDEALHDGVDVGQLLTQLLGYFRDLMVLAVGCPADKLLYSSAAELETLEQASQGLPLETLLAAMQIVDQALGRLRYTVHGRIVAELALVQVCRLADLEELPALVERLQTGQFSAPEQAPTDSAKKKPVNEPVQLSPSVEPPPQPATPSPNPPQSISSTTVSEDLTAETLGRLWPAARQEIGTCLLQDHLQQAIAAISAPNVLELRFPQAYNPSKAYCERPDQVARLEAALATVVGQPVRVRYELDAQAAPPPAQAAGRRPASRRALLQEKAEHPLVKRAAELFGAEPVEVREREQHEI